MWQPDKLAHLRPELFAQSVPNWIQWTIMSLKLGQPACLSVSLSHSSLVSLSPCLSVCLAVSASFRAACHVARQRRLDKFITTLLALLPLWLALWPGSLWGRIPSIPFYFWPFHILTSNWQMWPMCRAVCVCVWVSNLGVRVSSVN